MQYFFAMYELNPKDQLKDPSDNEILVKPLVFGFHEFDMMLKILFYIYKVTTFAILHYDDEVHIRGEAVYILNNVGMS